MYIYISYSEYLSSGQSFFFFVDRLDFVGFNSGITDQLRPFCLNVQFLLLLVTE